MHYYAVLRWSICGYQYDISCWAKGKI